MVMQTSSLKEHLFSKNMVRFFLPVVGPLLAWGMSVPDTSSKREREKLDQNTQHLPVLWVEHPFC